MGRLRQRLERLESESGDFDANAAPAVTVGAYAGLPASRRLVGSSSITATDGGAGSTLTLAVATSGVSAASYGSSTAYPTFTVGADGRLTAATSVTLPTHLEGAYSARGSPTDGSTYRCTDAPASLLRASGAWSVYYASNKCTPISVGGWSWVNQASTTTAAVGPYTAFKTVDDTAGRISALVTSAPAAPYTITLALLVPTTAGIDSRLGFAWRDSASGKLRTFCVRTDETSAYVEQANWTNATTLAASATAFLCPAFGLIFLRVIDNNTDAIMEYSVDGVTFVQLTTVVRTDHLTPNQVGICGWSSDADSAMTVLSWVAS